MTATSPLACACPGCRMPTAVHSLEPDASLSCPSCGRSFRLSEALLPSMETAVVGNATTQAAISGAAPRSRRGRGVATLVALAILIAGLGWVARPGLAAERQALRAYCAPLASSDAGYPRAIAMIRNRAWMATCLSQPDGAAAFINLPDPRIGYATVITGARLRELLAPLHGMIWNQRLALWIDGARKDEVDRGDGLGRTALAARGIAHLAAEDFGSSLRTAIGDETAAQAILDLLSGTPGADAQALGRRMLIDGEFPDQIVLRPFSGTGGTRLIDQGRPPYATATSGYEGLLLRCVGAGWPTEYRLLALRAGKG